MWSCYADDVTQARAKVPFAEAYAGYGKLPEGTKAEIVMKTLEVYRREDSLWIVASTHGDDDKVRAVPFDAVELDLGALWRLPNAG